MDLDEIITRLRQSMPMIKQRYGVESLALFGSCVRREQRPDSDLDLLVTFREPPSLLRFLKLENYLTDVLGVKVDLVMKEALKRRIGERILKEAVPV